MAKDEESKVHPGDEIDRGSKVGAVGESTPGLLLASVFFPIAGLVMSAIGGALGGKLMNTGVSKTLINDVLTLSNHAAQRVS